MYPDTGSSVRIAHLLSPGPWRTLCGNDVPGLAKQGCSNNCGIFVLMYTLYIVMGAKCDFTEENMPQIRRWWCLLLITNFPMPSEEARMLTRKRRRDEQKLQGVEDASLEKMCSESISSEEGDLETSGVMGKNEQEVLLHDTMKAAKWCRTQSFKGRHSLPDVVKMDKREQKETLEELQQCDDEDRVMELREPFMFSFQLKSDFEAFCTEIMDVKKLKVYVCFEE
ncbi:hypothetical protein OJAV_G00034750 [Oryzias javanicus]|uniref:Ubiquitin-like protease family profile domain-containing protein n=1 Tax=Oryzias javanicus TaxID=123683 RepID=A0A437DFY7_ORYJA|nr:hypothetical protein OJAV_G00034750 [Oryzias javanicus]